MAMAAHNVVTIRSDLDIVAARMAARDMARAIGFGAIDQARIATATSELARNIFVYAGEGSVTIYPVERDTHSGVEIIFNDRGPGIADVEQVLKDGFTTAGTMGMGLPGARRLMDELELTSTVGEGTTVTCRKWLR
jgi:serine/threonine-protein kinase RsbT